MSDTALAKLDSAMLAIAECKTAMEAKQIADIAEAARVYLERTNAAAETVNRAAEVRTLAERQMGEFLKTMPKATGAMGVGTSAVPSGNRTQTPTLAEIGISKKASMTAQRLADLPAEEVKERIAVIKASGDQPTPGRVLGFDQVVKAAAKQNWMPDRGMFIARGAVCAMQQILPRDGELRKALEYVRDWCNEQLNKLIVDQAS